MTEGIGVSAGGGAACFLCGGRAMALPVRQEGRSAASGAVSATFGSSRRDAGRVSLVRCSGCGMGWQEPMPTASALADIYRNMVDECRLSDEDARKRSAHRYARLLSAHAGTMRGRLLDVGCSTGVFVAESLQDGWDAVGVEPSAWLAAHARARLGARILQATLEDAVFEDRSLQAITMWDVLEHVSDPLGVLQKVVRLLRPGGILGVNIPNIASLPAAIMKGRWPLILPEHTYYYTPRSLTLLFERTGLEWLSAHAHPVVFSAGYVAARLRQHAVPGSGLAAGILRALRLEAVNIPVLMGEMTVFARRPA